MTVVDPTSLPDGRLLGVDLGSVRVGIAITDPDQVIATPAATIEVDPGATAADVAHAIAREAGERGASGVVIGSPRTLAGREGRAAAHARAVARVLASAHGLPVALVDERFTTVEATRAMHEQDVDVRAGREEVDRVAAALILQQALERRRRT